MEEDFEVVLVNARHIKHVAGRKTDVCDSEWLCKLLWLKTPEMKLTKPVISTKECCQEHAGEIFNIKLVIRFKETL